MILVKPLLYKDSHQPKVLIDKCKCNHFFLLVSTTKNNNKPF